MNAAGNNIDIKQIFVIIVNLNTLEKSKSLLFPVLEYSENIIFEIARFNGDKRLA